MTTIAVYLNSNASWGGSFQYAREVLEALSMLPSKEWKVYIYYHDREWDSILQRMGLHGEHLAKLRGFKRYIAGIASCLAKLLPQRWKHYLLRFSFPSCQVAARRPAIVLVPGQTCIYVSRSTRQIAAVHDLMHIYEPSFPEASSLDEVAMRTKLYTNIVHYCSDILVDSPLGAQHLLDNFPARPKQVHIVPFVPPTELLAVIPKPPAQPLPKRFFFYPAQFWLHKNHSNLLAACKIVMESIPDVHCVFTGATIYNGYSNVIKSIKDSGLETKITILGYVDDAILTWLYRFAQFMIYPSFFGPTNIPPLEAMLMGCPFAVSDRYAMPWQCGDAALYFNPSDPQSIADTIKRLWNDSTLRSELQMRGAAKSQQWTQANFHQRILEILQQTRVN